MALGFSATVADFLLDAAFGNTAYTGPATIYVQLHTGDPGSAGTANAATPVSAHGAGTRQSVAFSAASAASKANSGAATWTAVATSEQYTDLSLWDNATYGSGNFLASGTITASAVTSGDTFTIAIGGLTITLSKAA